MNNKLSCLFGHHTWSEFFAMATGRVSHNGKRSFLVSRVCLVCGKDDHNKTILSHTFDNAIAFRKKMEEERLIYGRR